MTVLCVSLAYVLVLGDIRGFMLESTDTLAVGRYILTVTEEETGCRGYGRFLVGASESLFSFIVCILHKYCH